MSFSRNRILPVGVLGAGALSLALLGCGSEQEVASSTTASEPPALSSSAPVVGGPRPASSTAQTSASRSGSAAQECGKIPGPDGSLRILVRAGNVNCDTAKQLATDYGPKIATGQQQTVNGWTCGPSEIEGMLAACVRGNDAVGFTP